VKDDQVVQSVSFRNYLPIGKAEIAIKYLTQWGADEILLLDISATKLGKEPNYELIERCARTCDVPLTVGGGISQVKHAQKLFDVGADKVSINYGTDPILLAEIGRIYGTQAIVLAVDVVTHKNQSLLYDYVSLSIREDSLYDFVSTLGQDNFGELLIQFVERDGSGSGYDVDFLREAASLINKPIIALGGYGCSRHIEELFINTKVSAAAIGNAMHHKEHSLIVCKSRLPKNLGIRFDSLARYDGSK
jgi:cyclase